MTVSEINAALEAGQSVFWKSELYKVFRESGSILTICILNDWVCGLARDEAKDCFVSTEATQ